MANKKLVMKLLIDTKSQSVLFAEAGKDVVDFLFSFLGLPVASVVRLLSAERTAGSVGNLYKSLEGLDWTYLQSDRNRTDILNPVVPSPSFAHGTLLLPAATSAKKYYLCDYCYRCVTDASGTLCPHCKFVMTPAVSYVDPKTGKVAVPNAQGSGGGGFVKGVVTYTIMDDLTVMPMSSISTITLIINKLQIKDLSVLQEKSVEVGFQEGVELLRASLQSDTVLTHVFLRGEK